jgi:hypothetical protein
MTTITTKVWCTSDYELARISEYQSGAVEKFPEASCFYSNTDMKGGGWSEVGVAEITIDLFGNKELVEARVDSLRAELTQVLAEAGKKTTEIEGKIQRLLALEMS